MNFNEVTVRKAGVNSRCLFHEVSIKREVTVFKLACTLHSAPGQGHFGCHAKQKTFWPLD